MGGLPAAQAGERDSKKLAEYAQAAIGFCLGEKVTLHQTMDVVIQYLQNTPEKRHLGANTLTLRALRDAFPCS